MKPRISKKVLPARSVRTPPPPTVPVSFASLPGFYNHKYAQPHWVSVEEHPLEGGTFRREQFPVFPQNSQAQHAASIGNRTDATRAPGDLSQSERDWAYAKRALHRGDSPGIVIDTIAKLRQDKHHPQYYAELTVRKAAQSLRVAISPREGHRDEGIER